MLQDRTGLLKPHLAGVRLRWKLSAALSGLMRLFVEAAGGLLVLLILDLRYNTSGTVRLVLLTLWLVALAYLAFQHVLKPLLRKIPDEQIAMLIEEHSTSAEGTVISAVEFAGVGQAGLMDALVKDAARRVSTSPINLMSTSQRFKKYLVVAALIFVISAGAAVKFSEFAAEQSKRLLKPWVSIRQEREQYVMALQEAQTRASVVAAPIEFAVEPGDLRLRRGDGAMVKVKLSRLSGAPIHLKFRGGKGEWQDLAMEEMDVWNSFTTKLEDISEPLEYYIDTGMHHSATYHVNVFDPLALKGIELVYTFPDYLGLKPVTHFSKNGDMSLPEGTQVDVRLVANQPLLGGKLTIKDGPVLELKPVADAPEGVKVHLAATKDLIYGYEITSQEGEKLSSSQFYYVKFVPDKPPEVKITWPKLDMTMHPLSEVTISAKLNDDYGVKSAFVKGQILRSAEERPLHVELDWKGKGTVFPGEIEAKCVLRLDEIKPPLAAGDMVFYHLEVQDMKGQTICSDVFYFKIMPLEISAAWPSTFAGKDYNHPAFNKPMDMIMFIAAAWALQQEKPMLKVAEFNKKSEDIADRMLCTIEMTSSIRGRKIEGRGNLAIFFGLNFGADAATSALAETRVEEGHMLLMQHEPGRAADVFRQALAIAEGGKDQAFIKVGINSDYHNLGMGSSDYKTDPLLKHFDVHAPSMMSDDMTFYQNMDNFANMRPPDYRRILASRELQVAQSKQLKELGHIYLTQEELVKDLESGHEDARTGRMVVDGAPPVNRKEAGGNEKMEKVDKRKKPVLPLKPSGATPQGEKMEAPPEDPDAIKVAKKEKDDGAEDEDSGPKLPGMGQAGGAEPTRKKLKKNAEDAEKMAEQMAMNMSGGGGGGGDDKEQKEQNKPGQDNKQKQKDAINQLRQAAAAMNRAESQLGKGDKKSGLASAKEAQQALQAARELLRGMQAADLGEAMAAAEEGASKIVENQRKIAEATEKAFEQAGEKSGSGKASQGGDAKAGKKEGGGQPAGNAQSQSGEQQNSGGQKGPMAESEIRAAVKKDPGLSARANNLAERQARNSEDLAAFSSYVDDLKNTAMRNGRNDVSQAMDKVAQKLKEAALEQKMVDSSIDLAQGDLGKARAAHLETERLLDETMAAVRQASEVMAGSKLGLVKKAAKEASEISKKASAMGGGGGSGQGQQDEMAELFSKTQNLAHVLEDQDLVAPEASAYLKKTTSSFDDFRKLFDKARAAEGQKFSSVMNDVSAALEMKLEVTLEAKKLGVEQREEYPSKFRLLVGKYYEALSRETTAR